MIHLPNVRTAFYPSFLIVDDYPVFTPTLMMHVTTDSCVIEYRISCQ